MSYDFADDYDEKRHDERLDEYNEFMEGEELDDEEIAGIDYSPDEYNPDDYDPSDDADYGWDEGMDYDFDMYGEW